MSAKAKLRLVKANVHFVFVVDDGEDLTEYITEPITIAAKDWPAFPNDGFLKSAAVLAEDLEAEFRTDAARVTEHG